MRAVSILNRALATIRTYVLHIGLDVLRRCISAVLECISVLIYLILEPWFRVDVCVWAQLFCEGGFSTLWKWQPVSWAVCSWSGPVVCGQKAERLLSGGIKVLTVRRSVENMGTVREMFAGVYTLKAWGATYGTLANFPALFRAMFQRVFYVIKAFSAETESDLTYETDSFGKFVFEGL